MRYCSRCQVIVKTGVACPSCGSKKLREVRENDPVLLYTADEIKCSAIRAAFDSNGIPHEERMCGPGAPPSILYGKTPSSLYHIFVPFGEVEHCKDIMRGIGVLGENESQSGEPPQGPDFTDSVEMSPLKRTAVRFLSAVAFLVIIWIVVTLADRVAELFKAAFL